MSFVDASDVRSLIEEMLVQLSASVSDKQIQQRPFPVITYADALDKYGVDRPDLRFGLELFDLSDVVAGSEFGVFSGAVAAGGQVKGLVYPGGASLTRREIDGMTDFVKPYGAKGLAWIGVTGEADENGHYGPDALRSQITKFLTPEEIAGIVERQRRTDRRPDSDRRRSAVCRGSGAQQPAPGHRAQSRTDRRECAGLLLGCRFPAAGIQRGHETLAGRTPSVHLGQGPGLGIARIDSRRRAGQGLRCGDERLGDRRRQHPYPPQRPAGSSLRGAWAFPSRRSTPSLVISSRHSSTARRRTAALRWASIDWWRSSPKRPASAM